MAASQNQRLRRAAKKAARRKAVAADHREAALDHHAGVDGRDFAIPVKPDRGDRGGLNIGEALGKSSGLAFYQGPPMFGI